MYDKAQLKLPFLLSSLVAEYLVTEYIHSTSINDEIIQILIIYYTNRITMGALAAVPPNQYISKEY